jgi:histidine ammonia-lyase
MEAMIMLENSQDRLKINPKYIKKVYLGEGDIAIEEFVAVARYEAEVCFSQSYEERVKKSRQLVEKILEENRLIYGVNTGFGDNVKYVISPKDADLLQKNIVRSHACSVGEPLGKELVRAIQLMALLDAGSGYSGISLEILELIRELLNRKITPYVPGEGSVGYLAIESHLALVLLGEGQAWFQGELLPGAIALQKAGLSPISLKCKEGLSIINGTKSITGIGIMALYDGINAAKVIDVAGALTFEALKGTLKAFDPRLHSVKRHTEQQGTARNMLRILQDSEIAQKFKEEKVQDCVSLRGIPQIHGAAKRMLKDALINLTNEMNSCSDNPIIYPLDGDGIALMGVNPEGSYVGIYCDSICIAMGVLAKLSERRIDRLTNSHFSGLPPFLVKNPGLNNGYMIAQYTAAGLVGDIKVLSHPSSVDSITTSANQEDFVSMAYFAARKAYQVAKKLQYILAIELMVAVQGLDLLKPLRPSSASQAVYNLIREKVPVLEDDGYIYPDIEYIFQLIRKGSIIDAIEEVAGEMEF